MIKVKFVQVSRGQLQVQISTLADAHEQIDHTIAQALRQRRPVYINISCNIAGVLNVGLPFLY